MTAKKRMLVSVSMKHVRMIFMAKVTSYTTKDIIVLGLLIQGSL